MATDILMPALTPTMEEGTLASWHVEPGDKVERGQVIAEIETDKSVLEFEALEAGVIGELRVEAGTEGVPVDSVIAILLEPGEKMESAESAHTEPAQTAESEEREGRSATAESAATERTARKRIPSSPAARRVAKECGIDLGEVEGTGPRGRILKADVENVAEGRGEGADADTQEGGAAGADTPYTEERLTSVRKAMARRMSQSKSEIPHLYCSVDIRCDALIGAREELGEMSSGDGIITLNDLIVLATALALRDNPRMNVQYHRGSLHRLERVDVAVAVAAEEGLVTPVIRAADKKRIGELASEIRELAERGRNGRLRPEEYEGGSFTVSNVGMLGIDQSWPIINPPQAGILGVGRIRATAVPAGEEIVVARMMRGTLSADHRVIDGALAGGFLRALKSYLERPARMLL